MARSARVLGLVALLGCALAEAKRLDAPLHAPKTLETRPVSTAVRGGASSPRPAPPPAPPPTRGGGKLVVREAAIGGAIFNLVNNVAGCGFLTLSSGMAGTGVAPAVGMVSALGLVSCWTFLWLGEGCLRYGVSDVRSLWAAAVSEETAWAVDASVGLFCGAAAVIYHGIVGDVFAPLVASATGGSPDASYARVVGAVALAALWPLCQLDLGRLAAFSRVGCASVALTALVILLRAVDGSYGAGGRFAGGEAAAASGGALGLDRKALVLCANLGLAFVAHYNAPPLAESLAAGRPASDPSLARDFNTVTRRSFAVLTVLYAAVMCAGAATFGDAARPNVLLNYHADDVLARVARLATGASIVFGFPLVFAGMYDALARLCPDDAAATLQASKGARAVASLALIAFTAVIAVATTDIGLPAGLSGSLLGGFVVYVFPALVKRTAEGATPAMKARAGVVALLGATLGLLGAQQTLSEYDLI